MPPAGTPFSPGYGRDLWRLGLAFAVLFFALLGSRPLSNPDEGRYSEIPREMLATGDFVTPRLDGVKYFEKPPLVYWLTAASFQAFGINEFSARLWPALFALGGVLLTYAAARALHDRLTGLLAAAALGSSLLYYGLSRLILLDLAVGVLIAAALFSFLIGIDAPDGRRRRALFLAFYVAMALGVMTKGLIALVLPLGVIGAWILFFNRWSALRRLYLLPGAVLFLAIAAPWHVLAARANPDFLHFYFVHEHFQRFTSTIHHRAEPWWYFLAVFAVGFFPAICFLGSSLRHNLAGGWAGRKTQAGSWFLLLWVLVIGGFFSLSHSKLIPYIIPVFPAAAVLVGRFLAARLSSGGDRPRIGGTLYAWAAISFVVGIAIPLVRLSKDPVLAADLKPWQWLLGVTFLAGALAVSWLTARGRTRAALLGLAATQAGLLLLINPLAGRLDKRSTREFALELRTLVAPGHVVYSYRDYFQDLPVYLGRTVDVVGYQGELAYGIEAEPDFSARHFIDEPEFLRRWQLPQRCFAVAKQNDTVALFARADFPHFVLAQARGKVLFSNLP